MEVVEAHPQRNCLSKLANKEGQTEMTKDSDRIKKILLQESTSNCRWRVYTLHDKTYPPFEKEEIKKRAKEQLDPKPAPLPVIGSQLPTANISATSAETVKVFASKLRRKKSSYTTPGETYCQRSLSNWPNWYSRTWTSSSQHAKIAGCRGPGKQCGLPAFYSQSQQQCQQFCYYEEWLTSEANVKNMLMTESSSIAKEM
ncbi:hypothetical protein QYM36_017881 [Artemia franciscana]|uniref:Uncharacterized protein n=1 Tax=Artemia franciscana TaxID=6661 RepID=A0AA88HAW3_ARTSF|nr:hypothetical protein QYM36_017849 [Artemia franciscana]KAK2703736.1 hypothetical protein QYM36_017881 [Artemia franciscana]